MKKNKKIKRCWEFFHCISELQETCMMAEADEWRCWLVNISCCKINKDTPRPLSVKHIVCKTCDYYKTYKESV